MCLFIRKSDEANTLEALAPMGRPTVWDFLCGKVRMRRLAVTEATYRALSAAIPLLSLNFV